MSINISTMLEATNKKKSSANKHVFMSEKLHSQTSRKHLVIFQSMLGNLIF